MFKYTIIIALASFAVFTHGIIPQPRKDAEDLLHELDEVIREAIDKANASIEAAKAEVLAAAQSVEASAQDLMQGAEDAFKAELDDLKKQAADAGVNIDECLGANEDALVNLPTTGTNSMVDCVAGKINQAFGYAQDALNKISNVLTEIETIRQAIDDCGDGLSSIPCLAELALKITEDIAALPSEIEADGAAAVALVLAAKEQIQQCADDAVNKVKTDGEDLLVTIGACVAGKIIGG